MCLEVDGLYSCLAQVRLSYYILTTFLGNLIVLLHINNKGNLMVL